LVLLRGPPLYLDSSIDCPDLEVRLPDAAVQGLGLGFQVVGQDVEQVVLRPDLLLGVGDAERLVEDGVEADLAAPSVVVVLPPLATHEEPAEVDLALRAHDGASYPGAVARRPVTLVPVAPEL
jgi:hypothetical protein